MTATPALTADLQRQVLILEDDLRARVAADAELEGDWKREHQRAVDKERTAASWVAWRDDRVTQAAVAWVLASVFIRFCEDNALVGPVWIAGPEHRRQEALDAQLAFFRTHPEDTDREWLQAAIDHLAALPATTGLVDTRSLLHLVAPSGNAVTRLLDFWRNRTEEGALVHDLADSSLSTRFLGDLYQDLSQHAKDTYALLQTPVFVEEFILDRTLEPALKERPLEGFRLIDPTCGSGHFLLGAFGRLLDRWHKHAPGLELQARVQATLDAIHGVDLNPFAVAIARFRLTVAALQAAGLSSLEAAPAFTFHLAVGDSLIHGPDPDVLPGMGDRTAYMSFTYATEDGPLLLTMLEEGRYDVVVGNPPYITPKDKALNQIYRSKYANVCKGPYALTVPFMALFFALAKGGETAGWVGQITGNSFMKREFGTPLIENFLVHQDLRLVADTSGAYIPGHGTPTVIIVGRNHLPIGPTVRAVLGVRSESERPSDPAKGAVWTSIIDHVDDPGWDGRWVTITDVERSRLDEHPWSLSGGGAIDALAVVNGASQSTVDALRPVIGRTTHTGLDDFFYIPANALRTYGLQRECVPVVFGEHVRDFTIVTSVSTLFPYSTNGTPADPGQSFLRRAWGVRTVLASRIDFEKTLQERGLRWFDHSMFFPKRFDANLALSFANVATHNHFAFSRDRCCFTAHSPVILLPTGLSEDDYLALLGVLNSSIACFWLKQNSQAKAGTSNTSGGGDRWSPEPWFERYEFTGTTLQSFPLPQVLPLVRGRELDRLGRETKVHDPVAVFSSCTPTAGELDLARAANERLRARMISVQEELDWECYRLYGLIEDDLTYSEDDRPGLALGERAFEIVLARAVQAGEEETAWFTRHGSTPITEIPAHWPTAYRELVRRRIDLIAADPSIRLLEKPEYKRRWTQEAQWPCFK